MKAHFEAVSMLERDLLLSRRFVLPEFDHPFHYHPEYEITYIERGRGIRIVGDHVGAFREGELYLLGADLPHWYHNTEAPARGAAAEVLHFRREPLAGLLDHLPELRAWRTVLEQAAGGLCYTGTAARAGVRLLRLIRQAHGLDRWLHFWALAKRLTAAAPALPLASPAYAVPTPAPRADRMHQAQRYILERYREDVKHADAARHVGMDPAAFSRAFRRSTRKTFTEFLTDLRLGCARRLLLETDRSIADIAFDSGFQNLSNFNRRFRAAHGMAPRQFRRMV